MQDNIIRAARVLPSERQYRWQQLEFYSFIHFTVNTFTNREWGDGKEDPGIFNPSELNADQWANICKEAGMKGMILTCKHHDGFCLWPSEFTRHSVKNSPWKDGEGDLVREVSDACRRAGLKFGIYLSPWDRHESTYGDSKAYNEFFKNQLSELLSNYGEIFCVWLDGACGEGVNGKRQVYDWDGYYKLTRELQPEAVISVCGPDVRWCGNEAGHCRQSEWSVVPKELMDAEKIAEKSQKVDDGEFSKSFNSMDEDLGSRMAIRDVSGLIWYPSEVNTSIRPGWFYHEEEDNRVKTVQELIEVYYNSVGGNACFLLNIPPDRRGLIHEKDAAVLGKLGRILKETFSKNLASGAMVKASESMDEAHGPVNVLDSDPEHFWRPFDGTEPAELEVNLITEKVFNTVVIKENIRHSGQHAERFALEIMKNHGWEQIYEGTVIGYKCICRFEKVKTDRIRIKISESRIYPTIEFFGIYLSEN